MLEEIYDLDDNLSEDEYYDALLFLLGDAYPDMDEEELEDMLEDMLDQLPEQYAENVINTIGTIGKQIGNGTLKFAADNPTLVKGGLTATGTMIGGPAGAKLGSGIGNLITRTGQNKFLPKTGKTLALMQNPQAQAAITRATLGIGDGTAPLSVNGHISEVPIATYLRAIIATAQAALQELEQNNVVPPQHLTESLPFSEDVDYQAIWLTENLTEGGFGNPGRSPSGTEGNAILTFYKKFASREDGIRRVYYVTSGVSGRNNQCKFLLTIENPAEFISFSNYYYNCFLMVSFFRTKNLIIQKWETTDGKPGTEKPADKKRIPIGHMKKAKEDYTINIPFEMIQKAYHVDPNDSAAQLDVEFYWQEAASFNMSLQPEDMINRKKNITLFFYLVEPINYIFNKIAAPIRNIEKENKFIEKNRIHIISVSPKDTGKIKISNLKIKQEASKDTITATASSEYEVSKEIGIKIPIEDILDISGKISTRDKSAFANTYSKEKSLMEGVTKLDESEVNLRPQDRPEKYKHIYLEPILDIKMVNELVLYEDIDYQGMAGKRTVIKYDIPIPIYYIKGWFINQDNYSDY